jgi:hypothetical protein
MHAEWGVLPIVLMTTVAACNISGMQSAPYPWMTESTAWTACGIRSAHPRSTDSECGNTDSNFFALRPQINTKTGSLRFGNK